MITPISIRPVEKEDFAAWRVLWDGYNAFYGRKGPSALPDDITRTTWSRFFDVYEPMHALVAERSGVLVGFTHFLFHRSTIQAGPSCYLQDLYTHDDARATGVGRALINGVYDRAMAANAPSVYWQTHETNTDAMHLYDQVAKKSGFIVYRKTFVPG